MNDYRVSFYKNLLNSNGHNFKCLQRQIDVQSDDPSHALILAEQKIRHERLNVDCAEVTYLPAEPYGFEHPSRPCALGALDAAGMSNF
jgi:hypothetical protein